MRRDRHGSERCGQVCRDPGVIEQAFSKLKAALRKGATRAVDALLKLICKAVKAFAPKECANYFRHAGYKK
jgi:hypothetical protein